MSEAHATAPWRERYSFGNDRLLGEDENGDLWVPSRFLPAWWDRRYQWWNPWHWPARWRSGRHGVEVIETGGSA